ncbi:MAG: MerR family transcriptional regulator [Shimia sp.]
MSKGRDAFRTISEVADWLDTQPHVLRFWESKFSQVKPVKRAGGRRYYRPVDMELLGGIKQLLHEDGVTIKGVQKILRERGVKYVSSLSRAVEEGAEAPDMPRANVVQIAARAKSPAQPSDAERRPAPSPRVVARPPQPAPEPSPGAPPVAGGEATPRTAPPAPSEPQPNLFAEDAPEPAALPSPPERGLDHAKALHIRRLLADPNVRASLRPGDLGPLVVQLRALRDRMAHGG